MSELKNANLEVSRFAMECVKIVKNSNINNKDYKTLVRKMSALIQENGFIATLVFNLSKISKAQHKEVLINIIKWNLENYKINSIKDINKDEAIRRNNIEKYIEWVTSLESQEYRLITKEMIDLFGWIKRFADGMIEGEE